MMWLSNRRPRRPLAQTLAVAAAGLGCWTSNAFAQSSDACQKPSDVVMVQLLNRWRAEFGSRDAERLSALYAPDAIVIATSDGKAYKGRDEIRNYYKDFLDKRPSLSIKPAELSAGCGTATISGPVVYRVSGERKGTRMLLGGRYTAEFVLRNGMWLITRQTLAADPRAIGDAFRANTAKPPPL